MDPKKQRLISHFGLDKEVVDNLAAAGLTLPRHIKSAKAKDIDDIIGKTASKIIRNRLAGK